MSPYLHQTQNRIRIRSDFIRCHPHQITETINQLSATAGVQHITWRRYAGSVAIYFCSEILSGHELLQQLKAQGWLNTSENRVYLDKSMRLCTRTLVKGLAVLTVNLALKSPLLKKVTACMR